MSRYDTSTSAAGLKADARNRALRSFLQGLAVDVAVAVSVLLITVFATADSWGDIQWAIVGFSFLKTILTTIAAFIMRRFVDHPGSIALPPAVPGPPAESDVTPLRPAQDE